MHKKILNDATSEQVLEFATDFVTMLKARDTNLYEEAENWLYKEVYGCHFNDWLLDCATKGLLNEDGTVGPHWTVDQTNSVAKSYSIKFNDFNQYDWNYAMNVIYADYFGIVPNETSTYVKMASRFLGDKDAPSGKAYKYYVAMKGEE